MSTVQKFDGWGIVFEQPTVQVKMPADITDISSDNLGKLFTELTAWTDFIATQVVTAQLNERMALKEKDRLENKLLVQRMGSGVRGERITAVKAEISVNQDVIDLDNDYEEKYAYRKGMEVFLNNLERDLSLVSREITRRSNEARKGY